VQKVFAVFGWSGDSDADPRDDLGGGAVATLSAGYGAGRRLAACAKYLSNRMALFASELEYRHGVK